jgi:D-alanine-D-alanine ligase
MRIGITFDLKAETLSEAGLPDDFQEEFDSPVTLDALAGVLSNLGHEVERLGDGRELLEKLLQQPPDLVFNIAEGQGIARSREARVPAVLEMLNVPYTGSDPLTLAATLDKDCAKRLVQSAGLAVPQGMVLGSDLSARIKPDAIEAEMRNGNCVFPVIVKPAWEGSSKGIRGKCVADTVKELLAAVEVVSRDHRQPVLIEEFIDGEELTVGIVGNTPPQVLGVMQVCPADRTSRFIYSLEVKRDYRRQVKYQSPPRLSPEILARVHQAALKVYKVLGCRDVARVDFRLRGDVPYFLEVNPLPGINPNTSDLVILARLCDWSYERLIGTILQAAIDRYPELKRRSESGSIQGPA